MRLFVFVEEGTGQQSATHCPKYMWKGTNMSNSCLGLGEKYHNSSLGRHWDNTKDPTEFSKNTINVIHGVWRNVINIYG